MAGPGRPLTALATQAKAEAVELCYWTEPKKSGIALLCGLVYFYLVGLAGWTTIGLLSTLTTLTLGLRLAYYTVTKYLSEAKLITKRPAPPKPAVWLSEGEVADELAALTSSLNAAAQKAHLLLYCDDPLDTLYWLGGCATFAWLHRLFGITGLFFLAFVLAFALPKAYEKNKAQVDAALDVAAVKLAEGYDQAAAKAKEHAKAAMAKLPKIPTAKDVAEPEDKKNM